ncbi:putative F-box/LRR-repeat protein 23 [Bidens hawaiensis]|uniref:putative F-box/LRR-repeat protein 23 n=1 Tax=Bidens hawaiensis TaxID=980011 RepID=UPI004049AD1D
MPPKSNTRKRKKIKKPTRNWLELPSDVTLNILKRVDVADRLENVQKVCTAWGEICKDPSMWRVVYIDDKTNRFYPWKLWEMCKDAVDRSQGQLLDLTVIDGFNDELLHYVADRSSQLRRLEMLYYYGEQLSEALKKLSKLVELSFVKTNISQEVIEAVGRHCPLLKTLKTEPQRKVLSSERDSLCNRETLT